MVSDKMMHMENELQEMWCEDLLLSIVSSYKKIDLIKNTKVNSVFPVDFCQHMQVCVCET